METKNKDLEDDEELAALRMAALATLKSRPLKKTESANLVLNASDHAAALFRQKFPDSEISKKYSGAKTAAIVKEMIHSTESNHVSKIDSIVTPSSNTPNYASNNLSKQIPFIQTDRLVYSTHSNSQYTWRKSSHTSRRRGGAFSKASQRSNLIVISPVSLEEKKSSCENVPALVLPQHKWSQSQNEDSMSPKAYRRTGPTRFHRHDSDSESSDSDMDDNSDNDSYSNETVLQDEHTENNSRLSPEESNEVGSETVLEKDRLSERRLSFQNLNSDINLDKYQHQSSNVFNGLKSTCDSSDSKSENDSKSFKHERDSEYPWLCKSENNYNCNQYNSTILSVEKNSVKQTNTSSGNDKSIETCNSNVNCGQIKNCANKRSSVDLNRNGNCEQMKVFANKKPSINHVVPEAKRSIWLDSEMQKDSVQEKHLPNDARSVSDSDNKYVGQSEPRNRLSQNDLRFELKKRMQDYTCKNTSPTGKQDSLNHCIRHRSSSRDRISLNRERKRNQSGRWTRSRSRSSSYSSTTSSSSSSSSNSSPAVRSVSSVVKPVEPKIMESAESENQKSSKNGRKSSLSSSDPENIFSLKRKVSNDQYKFSSIPKMCALNAEGKNHGLYFSLSYSFIMDFINYKNFMFIIPFCKFLIFQPAKDLATKGHK
ncbi:uncharacterized protein DDB_G0271670-like [Stegodyphus dumicola]|uniref:uncharacterized protein DDB_G0271670-like n=1 Tax=Stegodyphus dumicola TaxID=202533 RepID=UPI0015B03441|nr:uncharacterized protein DDB_G0271670-like [Stegodyphus dumicola]